MKHWLLPLWLLAFAAHAIPEGPDYPSPEWSAREAANYARTLEAPAEQAAPAFQARLQAQNLANQQSFNDRILADPSWLGGASGNSPLTPLCSTWMFQCAGDPFRYPGVDGFYETEGEVIPVVFYDRGCARISGRVWAPRGGGNGLPAVVIENGSIQAPEPLYWWFAQALVRQGYVVMTFDPRGQGRSDQQTPDGDQGSNANATVFWDGLVDAIDFFRSGPVTPYPHNLSCAGRYPTETTAFNPHHARIDRERLGLAGHSLGASGVSVVQSYGAPGAEPWPGLLDAENPVDVIVAWDSLNTPGEGGGRPAVVPRVPAMGQSSEYGIGGTAFSEPPDPDAQTSAFRGWQAAGLPVFELTIQGSTHFEWSLIPTFPATSWCPGVENGRCLPGWGQPMAEHYSLAWMDRWLKRPGEPGFDDAETRLLADADWQPRYSFYFRSARDFPLRAGGRSQCLDIRAGCTPSAPGSGGASSASGGGALGAGGLALFALLALTRRRWRG
ncbi:MAG TPA: hypothetical protein VFV27_10630 [Nevskiaceae bacterium]|nr:hypothetical protein [Nevskiaceae bacterium]